MSITYNQDTSALVINDIFKLDLTTPRISMPSIGNKKALAVITNESGCTLQISLSGGRNFTLPAGAWTKPFQIYPQDSKLSAQVQNILPNSQINLFSITIYNPGEEVIEPAALGNSPIGISGNVATSNIQSLTNDGNAAPTQIIESTPTGQGSSSFSLNNDGSGFWQILSANTLKQIINAVRGNTGTGKAVINIGDAGDLTITTFNGSLNGNANTSGAVLDDVATPNLIDVHRSGAASPFTELLVMPQPAGSSYQFGIRAWDGAASHDVVIVNTSGNIPAANISGLLSSSVTWALIDADSGAITSDGNGKLTVASIHATGTGGTVLDSTAVSNAGIEHGNTGAANTPFIDWHSSGFANDYDVRIVASGGVSAVNGAGTLQLVGRSIQISVPDGSFSTMRQVQEFINTIDPSTYATVNEGDTWIKG